MEIKDIRSMAGISRAEFSRKYSIPYRTVEDWENGKGKAPIYVKELLERVVREDFMSQQNIGHWIMTGVYYTGAYETIDYVECSCCGEYSLEEGDYCPNCGAKMESDK